jgi:predicted enzyme related to lactoylglutathione lyase
MAIRTSTWPAGTPCWADMSVPDVAATSAFYEAVFGWAFLEPGPDDGGYSIATKNGHPVAALGPVQSPDQPMAWLLYFASENADATAALIKEHGGAVLLEPGDAGAYGRLLVAADATGASFAVWQAGEHIGAGLVNEPGGLTWEDLRSTDPGAAQDFYAKVFGFDMNPLEMAPGNYRTFHLAGNSAPLGGIGGFMGPEGASGWELYFGVGSTDDAVAAAERAGGTVTIPAFDSPFGRMAGMTDPNGALFHVIETEA